MTSEERCMAGLCSDCDKPVKKWTREEIQTVKDDLGMTDDDDFGDACLDCLAGYIQVPVERLHEYVPEADLEAQCKREGRPYPLRNVQG